MTSIQPIYLLIDVSGSMRGAAIEAVRVGMQALHVALLRNSRVRMRAALCIMTFGHEVDTVRPLGAVEAGDRLPLIEVRESGPSNLGLALERLRETQAHLAELHKPPLRGIICIMTDGVPSDIARFEAEADAFVSNPIGRLVACVAGPRGRREHVARLTDDVVHLDVTNLAFWDDLFADADSDPEAQQEAEAPKIDWAPPPEHQVVI